MKPKVLVIVGPTASGKSDLAIRLAKDLNGEIISADSRQVYKGLDIGTGKVTKREMQGVPHHLLDVANPKKQFTAADFKKLAEEKIDEIHRRGRLPIVVGGTGFYIDTIAGKVLPDVPPDNKLRKLLSKKSPEQLFAMLKRKDPKRAETIDPNNKVRLIRALEIVKVLGQVPKAKRAKLKYDLVWIGLKLKRAELESRIYKRLLKRLPRMILEAIRLYKKGLSYRRMEELGLEYRYLSRFLRKKIDRKTLIAELYKEIRNYSKRQATWFKRNGSIRWFDSPSSAFRATTRALSGSRRPRSRGR